MFIFIVFFIPGCVLGAAGAFLAVKHWEKRKRLQILTVITENRHLHPAIILERVKSYIINQGNAGFGS